MRAMEWQWRASGGFHVCFFQQVADGQERSSAYSRSNAVQTPRSARWHAEWKVFTKHRFAHVGCFQCDSITNAEGKRVQYNWSRTSLLHPEISSCSPSKFPRFCHLIISDPSDPSAKLSAAVEDVSSRLGPRERTPSRWWRLWKRERDAVHQLSICLGCGNDAQYEYLQKNKLV